MTWFQRVLLSWSVLRKQCCVIGGIQSEDGVMTGHTSNLKPAEVKQQNYLARFRKRLKVK